MVSDPAAKTTSVLRCLRPPTLNERAQRWVDRLVARMTRESAGTPATLALASAALLELRADTAAGTVTEATLAAIAEELSARGRSRRFHA